MATTAKKEEDVMEMFLVTDLTASKGPRTHDFRHTDGKHIKKVTFPNDESAVEIPVDYARGLIGIDGFRVTDLKGIEQKPRVEYDMYNNAVTLPPSKVIADVEELTQAALLVRAAKVPGSDFKGNASREALINFLMGFNASSVKALSKSDAPVTPTERIPANVHRPSGAKLDGTQVKARDGELPGGLGLPSGGLDALNMKSEITFTADDLKDLDE